MTKIVPVTPNSSRGTPIRSSDDAAVQSELKISRSLWPWGYLSEYSVTGVLSHFEFITLVDRCINYVLPPEFLALGTVNDMKGVDRIPEPGEELAVSSSKAMVEEVVFLAGQYAVISETAGKDKSFTRFERVSLKPFRLYLLSAFDEFLGPAHIRHKLNFVRQGNLPEDADLHSISIQPGVVLHHLRIGLELFESQLEGELGPSPVADQRLILEAAPGKFHLSLIGEALAHATDLPLERDGLLDRLNSVFEELFKFDIQIDYVNKSR